jgi:hypothetical protein
MMPQRETLNKLLRIDHNPQVSELCPEHCAELDSVLFHGSFQGLKFVDNCTMFCLRLIYESLLLIMVEGYSVPITLEGGDLWLMRFYH